MPQEQPQLEAPLAPFGHGQILNFRGRDLMLEGDADDSSQEEEENEEDGAERRELI